MKKITDIYEQYKIMPNLEMHQLRVAAVARQICDSLDLKVDKDVITKAALLHDMGNVIKFDLKQTQAIFGYSDTETEKARVVQSEFIEKYGSNEHEATAKIIKELGFSEDIAELANQNRFSFLCDHVGIEDIRVKIIHYSDMRVGPHGVISYDERMDEAGKRYKNHPQSIEEQERQKLIQCGRDIEKQIFSHSNIKPEDINDQSVKNDIEKLKNFEI